ncbi:MAG: DUF971 domain-containing protein [Bdellovibrionota bacterium]
MSELSQKGYAPTDISRQGASGVRIVWSDGRVDELSSKKLRENCPSAVSKAKRGDQTHDKPLTAKKSLLNIVEASSEEETSLVRIWGIGNYAIGMEWADGHNTGIYTYPFLRELGKE